MIWNWFKSKPPEPAPEPHVSVELLKILFDDKSKEAREAAKAKLLGLKEPETVSSLTDYFDNGYSFRRGDILKMLGELGMPQAVPLLINVLHDNSSPPLQCIAARALGKMGDPASMTALGTVLQESFWRHPSDWQPPNMGLDISRQEALKTARREEAMVRRSAVEALKVIGTPEALQIIASSPYRNE